MGTTGSTRGTGRQGQDSRDTTNPPPPMDDDDDAWKIIVWAIGDFFSCVFIYC